MDRLTKSILAGGLLFLVKAGISQPAWVQYINNPDTNFYVIQESFEQYWKGRQVKRGIGWKPFKRWAYFMAPRVYPSGRIPDPAQKKKALARYRNPSSAARFNKSEWAPLGPADWTNGNSGYNPGNGRINDIVVHPQDTSIIYVATPSGGLWKSKDGGQSWNPLTDTLSVIGGSAIAIHPDDPDTLYLATGDGDGGDTYSIGLLRSEDGGGSWQSTGLSWSVNNARQINDILVHPDRPQLLLAASDNGIYRSTDGAQNWNKVSFADIKDLALIPARHDIVYAAGNQFYRSVDTGKTFTNITNGLPASFDVSRMAIGVSPDKPHYVYVLSADASTGGYYGLYRSIDSGKTFNLRSSSPNILGYSDDGSDSRGQGWYDLSIAVAPGDAETVYTGGINVWKSTDGGTNWNIVSHWYYYNTTAPYVHADIHHLGISNGNLFAGCDGGIFKTGDGGDNWKDLSKGLKITQFYRIDDYPGNAGIICGGSQDNGSNLLKSGSWTHVYGADGMECLINHNNADIVYVSSQNGGIRKSTDGGQSFTDVTSGISGSGAWVTPYDMHPSDPKLLTAAFEDVWYSRDGGNNWTKISAIGSQLHSLEWAPADTSVLFTATYNDLYKTTDRGNTWTNITSGLPTSKAAITDVEVHHTDTSIIWVTFSGYSANHKVYKSVDGGSNWINYTDSLPNVPVNCITFDKQTAGSVYIGTDVGVFYRDTSMNNWISYRKGLPNAIIRELEIHYPSNLLRAATHGRGLWEVALFGCTNNSQKPYPQFSISDTVICQNTKVQLTAEAKHCPQQWKWDFGEGGNANTDTLPQVQVKYTQGGEKTIRLTVSNKIGDSTLVKKDYLEVVAIPDTPVIKRQDSVLYISQSPDSVQWYEYGFSLQGAQDTFYRFDEESQFSVKVFNKEGCNVKSDPYTITGNASAQRKDLNWRVYPNPVQQRLHIKGEYHVPGPLTIKVQNIYGQNLLTKITEPGENTFYYKLDMQHYPAGIYLVKLMTQSHQHVQKVIIK